MTKSNNTQKIAGFFIIVFIFIAVSFFVHHNSELLKNYIHDDLFSRLLYIGILIVSAIIAPVDVLFLLPIATASWGWQSAGFLSLIGWTIGSCVVFIISRRFGTPLFKKYVSLEKIIEYEKFIPQTNIFFGIIFLRIAIPMDIISYTLGIFSDVKFLPYTVATFLGYLPLAFSLAYLGTLSIYMQIIGFFFFLCIAGIGYISIKNKKPT